MKDGPDTQEILTARERAWEVVEDAARAADEAWRVYIWALEVYPQVMELAGGAEVGFVTAGPNGGGGLAFEHGTTTADRIYGQSLAGRRVIDTIPPELHERHLAGLNLESSGYLSEDDRLVIQEYEIIRHGGERALCRFVVKKFPNAPVSARYVQFIWEVVGDG